MLRAPGFGARLASVWDAAPWQRVAAGFLFVLAPALAARGFDLRMQHESLCAHWLLLGMLALALRPLAPGSGRRPLLALLGWSVLAGGIHPHLSVMVLLLGLSLVVRLALFDRALRVAEAAAWAVAVIAVMAGTLVLFGYIGGPPPGYAGFGLFSADALTFVSSMGRSRLLAPLGMGQCQYEGYAYLGAGGVALVGVALVMKLAKRAGPARASVVPVTMTCTVLALFALSSEVTVAGRHVADLASWYAPFSAITEPLRSSGRFAWPLMYLLLALAVGITIRASARWRRGAGLVLAGAVALQLVDVSVAVGAQPFQRDAWRMDPRPWELARGEYDRLALIPPQVPFSGSPCGDGVYDVPVFFSPFAYQAYALGHGFNSGHVARFERETPRVCAEQTSHVLSGQIDARTIYVVHPALLGAAKASGRLVCGPVDGVDVCVAEERRDRFRAALQPSLSGAR
jgi:hypothetical protein